MSRIVIDARIINSSTGRYVERLLTHLQSIDTENEYIVLVPKKDYRYWKPKNKNFTVKIADYKNYSLSEQFAFAWFLYKLKADLVHFCMPQQPLLYFKPAVTCIHDLTLLKTYNSDKNWLIYHFKQLVGRFVFWAVAHKTRYIITISDFSRQEILERYKISSSKVIRTYLAADKPSAKPKKIKLPAEKYIMYVGQQSDYKNVRNLVRAHQEIVLKKPELGLVLVGGLNKAAKNNQTWVTQHNFRNVHFTGFVSDEELSWLYTHTQAYVFPSLMEGFGLPSLEAMSYGAPVVSSNATCLPEVNSDAAVYFDPLNVDGISQAIEKVLDDKKLRQSLVKKGYSRVARFSWEKTAEETLEIYQRALKNE